MSNDVSVAIDVANQSITSSDTNIITVPTQNFEIVTFDNKPCIRANGADYATFTINPAVKGFSCDIFLQAVNYFTLFIEFDTVLNTKYSLVYYPYGKWTNPDNLVFDRNNVLVGVWVTVTYSSANKTITFDNGTNQLVRTIDSNIVDLSVGSYSNRYNIYLTNFSAETSNRYVNKPGVAEIWLNIKNYVYSQLLGKQDTLVSGTNIKTVNNQSLLGSGNVSFTPPTFTYDSSTETLTVSNTTATVFNYDANSETLEIQVNG